MCMEILAIVCSAAGHKIILNLWSTKLSRIFKQYVLRHFTVSYLKFMLHCILNWEALYEIQ
jgi:hypothetical protein